MTPRRKHTDNLFMTAHEVSRYLRIPLSTVYYLTHKREIQAIKIGKHWRYRKCDIDRVFNPAVTTKHNTDRRKSPRINSNTSCNLIFSLPTDYSFEGIITNISYDGALLSLNPVSFTHTSLRIDDPLQLQFSLPNKDHKREQLCLNARILRISNNSKYQIAVKFRQVISEVRETLISYIG